MARRRMFSSDVLDQESFLEMPSECQALYVHLNMNADDDGFVQPKGVMRKIMAKDDSLKILLAKGFVLPFPNKVMVIRHWGQANKIQKDRYHPTMYQNEKRLLQEVGGKYSFKTISCLNFTAWLSSDFENKDIVLTDCIQSVNRSKEVRKEKGGSELEKMHKEEENKIQINQENPENTNAEANLLGLEKCKEKMKEIYSVKNALTLPKTEPTK